MPDPFAGPIDALRRMSVPHLKQRYLEVFGEPTRAHHRQHLVRRIAWRLQSLREGGLSDRALRRAQELANEADLRVRPPRAVSAAEGPSVTLRVGQARDPRVPNPGTVIRKRYKTKTLLVKVLDRGFEYEGEVYRSLSAVAKAVTGSHWNGLVFFGLAGKEAEE